LGLSADLTGALAVAGDFEDRAAAALFSESQSRFVASVQPSNRQRFEALFGSRAVGLGEGRADVRFELALDGRPLVRTDVPELLRRWSTGLEA